MDPLTGDRTGPELFFGLVGPLGANLRLLGDVIKEVLSDYVYSTERIRLTDLLEQFPGFEDLPKQFEDKRIKAFMDAGTRLRETTERPDAMAILGIQKVRKLRTEACIGRDVEPLRRQAYVFHSLKRPEEIDTLRRIYGPAFYVIGAYSPRE